MEYSLCGKFPTFSPLPSPTWRTTPKPAFTLVPAQKGLKATRLQTIAYTTALIPVSLILVPMGTAGWLYASVALIAGTWLLYLAAKTPQESTYRPWAVRYFYGTLFYLPAVTLALAADTLIVL